MCIIFAIDCSYETMNPTYFQSIVIRGKLDKQLSGSLSFVDLLPKCQPMLRCGSLCQSIRSWKKYDSFQIGIGFYDEFNCMLNKEKYKAIILIDSISQYQARTMNQNCPTQSSSFRPSYQFKKL